MNLLDKKLLGAILVLALAFFSCEEENGLGSNINPAENKLKVEFQEFTLPAMNVFFDSVRTDLDPYILTGTIRDDVYGKIEVEGYQSINILSSNVPPTDAQVDSAVINLRFSTYFTDPSAKSHEILVSQLRDTLYDGVVYNANRSGTPVRNLDGEIAVVGRHQFEIDPQRDSVLSFRLNDDFATFLVNKITPFADGGFRSFAPGEINPIALTSVDGNDALIGFDPNTVSSNITIHYQTDTEDSLQYQFTLSGISNTDFASYNHVKIDRSGSVFAGLTDDKLQVVDVDNDLVYMHPLTGIMPKVDLTEVYQFFNEKLNTETNISLNILSSQIVMPVDPSDTTLNEQFSNNLRYYFSNSDGQLDGGEIVLNPGGSVVLTDDSYLGQTNGPIVSVGRLDDNTFAITRDISIFTQLMIENRLNPDVENGAFPTNLVMLPSLSSAFEQTSFFKDGIKMRVYYTVLN